jgi:hypothetical protein
MTKKLTYRTSEKFSAIDIGGVMVTVYYTEDLDNDALMDSFKISLARENYEYCAALVAEGDKRGLKLKAK